VSAGPVSDRADELAAHLAALEQRLAAGCAAASRPRTEITVVAVTKTFPASDVRALVGLGVHDIGENRDQEAAAKVRELTDLDVRWHFVGQLQTNKCRSVAAYADVVHSLDRPGVVDALAQAAHAAGRTIDAFIQVALDDAPGRGGAQGDDVLTLADRVAAAPSLRLAGVMAVAPLGAPPEDAFGRLREVAARVVDEHPAATGISAGMSGDLEPAISAGATHVRIGTALLGGRTREVG
jgi:pyridoxal phosphate enzyme (YggS family)